MTECEAPLPLDLSCGTLHPLRWTAHCVVWHYAHASHASGAAENKTFEMDVIVQTTEGCWEYAGRRGREIVDGGALVAGVAGRGYGCRHDRRFPDRNLIASLRPGARDDGEPLFEDDVVSRAGAPRLEWALAAGDPDTFDSRVYETFEAVSSRSCRRERRPAGRVRAERAKRFIEAHAFEAIALADVARAVSLTPFSCLRQFGAHVGTTPHAYRDALRAREACRQLAGTSLPVGRIAANVGLSDPCYFARWFARAVGTTPTAYRRAHR